MGRMLMLVGAVLALVLVSVQVGIAPLNALGGMLVKMSVGVVVGMLMPVHTIAVGVFMAVHVRVLVGMQMLVFVFSFHDRLPFVNFRQNSSTLPTPPLTVVFGYRVKMSA